MSIQWRFTGILIATLTLGCSGQRRVPPQTDVVSPDDRLAATASVIPFDSAGHRWRRYVSQKFTPVTSFVFTGVWPPQDLVLHETATQICCQSDDHPVLTTLTVAAFRDSSGSLFGPIWRSTFVADFADVWSESFYSAVLYGCCGRSNKVMFASLRSGRTVFVATDNYGDMGLPSIDVPNAGGRSKRFAAFHDLFTSGDPPEARAMPDLVGVLQYGSLDGPTTRVLLRCPTQILRGGAGSYQFDSLAFRVAGKDSRRAILLAANHDSSSSALSGFQLHLTLFAFDSASTTRQSVLVPITHDSVDIAHATVPGSCTLSLAGSSGR